MATLQQCTEAREAFLQLVKIEQSLSVKDVFKKPLVRDSGDKVSVIEQIVRVVEYFLQATGKEMDSFQIQIIAGDLYDKFGTDSIEDIILMFKLARTGEFGRVYKVDTFTVMDWANAYLERKSITREALISKKKPEKKTDGIYFDDLPDEIKSKFSPKKEGTASGFLPEAATRELTNMKRMRELARMEREDKKE